MLRRLPGGQTVRALTDIIEADRATRLEATIVVLILVEILITIVQMVFFGQAR